jgi:peptidoglycan/LPS O-acetylase OafA/YrhL
VRALAVALVLAFHLQAPWVPGGYLGVSVFFTLSGFLITSLLLREHAEHGRIDVGGFYVRRLRRLVPASVLCLGAVSLLAMSGVLVERASLRSELNATVLQYANWSSLLSGRSYGALFEAPSPVAHFWSLAIEEQFYALWPIAMVALGAWAARRPDRPRVQRALVGTFLVLAVSAPLTAALWSADAAYFASWARFAEITAGAALAAVLTTRRMPASARALAPLCLAAIVALAVVSPAGRGWAYRGGLPAFALLSVGLIAGLQVEGPVRTALSWRPAVWVGKVSYGIYVFHWPVFAVLDHQRTGLDGVRLAEVRVGVSVALAALSFHFVERPVRSGLLVRHTGRYLLAAGAAASLVLLVASSLPELRRPADTAGVIVLAGSTTRAEAVGGVAGPAGIAPPAPTAAAPAAEGAPVAARGATVPPGPTTVAIFGDSVPDWLLRDAAASYTRTDVTVIDAAHEACDGVANAPRLRERKGLELFAPVDCRPWTASYPEVVDGGMPVDIAVLVIGQAPLVDRFVGGAWVSPCTDMSWYAADVEARIAYLRGRVGSVVLALPAWGGHGATWTLPDDHLERESCVRDRLHALAVDLAVPTVDLAEQLCLLGKANPDSPRRERDGVHVDAEDAPEVLYWLLDRAIASV